MSELSGTSSQHFGAAASAVAVDVRADGDAALGGRIEASSGQIVVLGGDDLRIVRSHVTHAVLDGQNILEVFPFGSGLVCLDCLFGHVQRSAVVHVVAVIEAEGTATCLRRHGVLASNLFIDGEFGQISEPRYGEAPLILDFVILRLSNSRASIASIPSCTEPGIVSSVLWHVINVFPRI